MNAQDSLPEPSTGGINIPEWSVSELSQSIKRTMEDAFGHVRVRGELGRASRPASGHVYLDLKDDRAVLNGVIWKGAAAKMRFKPEEGLEVIATGRITTFPGQSKYQIIIEGLEPAGAGALVALLEERKKKLAAEGLFTPERKKELPFLPKVIGVVTSPTGAVIRDILHRLSDRFPRQVLVWPVAVQGEAAASQVANAVRGFNALTDGGAVPRPELIIVARGGGSVEDLWAFNEEAPTRAVAESDIPVISAVGHETDTTLIDFVSDRRAPTPTAAAEIAVPVRAELLAQVVGLERRQISASARLFEERRERLKGLARGLPRLEDLVASPRQRLDLAGEKLRGALRANLDRHRQALAERAGLRPTLIVRPLNDRKTRVGELAKRLDAARTRLFEDRRQDIVHAARQTTDLQIRLNGAVTRLIADRAQRLSDRARLMETLSYKATLARGFAMVRDGDGRPVHLAKGVKSGHFLDIEFADGHVAAVAGSEGTARPASRPVPAKKTRSDQGQLF